MTSWWRPDRFAQKREKLEARARILAALRGYFADQDFIEVDTPALQATPGPDPHIHAFATTYELPHGGQRPLWLQASPELSCKKLLTAGMERIYQLSHVFRNREGSSRHQPEFMLLEWYRTGAGYRELMDDCMALLRAALEMAGADEFSFAGTRCDAQGGALVVTVQQAFQRFAGFDVLAADTLEKIRPEAARLKVRVAEDDRWEDVVLRMMAEHIEPHLGLGRPCFLTDYPIAMAALARPKPNDPRLAERFELYVCGVELANAFVELTDAEAQRTRLVADNALRKKLYGVDAQLDGDFLDALQHGMPQAAGIALGVDRLVMLATGAEDIADVVWQPVGD